MTLEKAVVDLLLANGLTISTVESCTGGLLAARLINVPICFLPSAFPSLLLFYLSLPPKVTSL